MKIKNPLSKLRVWSLSLTSCLYRPELDDAIGSSQCAYDVFPTLEQAQLYVDAFVKNDPDVEPPTNRRRRLDEPSTSSHGRTHPVGRPWEKLARNLDLLHQSSTQSQEKMTRMEGQIAELVNAHRQQSVTFNFGFIVN